ncbi:MAG TPA: translocation/assembly module TamB domain-containing protein [Gemmatimonadaceae bacterium]|nr:translocation/assembly module TamB domain-containing protein [Gemmatimonadaceae bacterium]
MRFKFRVHGRRLVIIAGVLTLTVGLIAVGAVAWLLKSRSGVALVRQQLVSLVQSKLHGKVYVGEFSGALLTHPRIDSLEVRDENDSLFIATGPVTFEWDLLDLWDKRVALRNVVVERPAFYLRHGRDGSWNYKKVFGIKDNNGPSLPRLGGRKLGDVVVFDDVQLKNGVFVWTEPWDVPSWLRGAQRDSAIKFNLDRKDADVRRVGNQLWRVRHWRGLDLAASHIRVKDPEVPGFAAQFTDLDVNEEDPPFNLHDARGRVFFQHDTVRLTLDGFRLPGSVGSASGQLFTKRGLGVRVRVIGDSVSMQDIAWLYPTLPTTGTGKMTLDIRKDSTNDHIDYILTKMDVSTTSSRLLGAMTFGVGDEILTVKNVNLELAPVDFRLIETFNGGPLALPWAGQLRGHVYAKGGPLDHFWVDSAAIEFADANVPGVVNRARGFGEVDIVRPLYTTFHDFAIDAERFDLRTAKALNKLFPPYKGWVSGSARLDSIWTDVRFRNGDFTYTADTGIVSHFTGAGRVTTTDLEMIYDLALEANPFRLEAVGLAYPGFPMAGPYRGAFTVKGPLRDMTVSGEMTGAGLHAHTNRIHLNGLGPVFSAEGVLDFAHLDPAKAFTNAKNWRGDLSGAIDLAISGDSLAHLMGGAKLTIAPRSSLSGVRIQGGYARTTLGEGLMRVDSMTLSSDALSLRGAGALGLSAARHDSLTLRVDLDSLGGARAFLLPSDSSQAVAMAGSVNATLRLFGSLDSLDAQITARSTDLVYGTTTAAHVSLDGRINDFFKSQKGELSARATNLVAGGMRFTTSDADARLTERGKAIVNAHMIAEKGSLVDGLANVEWDSVATRIRLDSLQVSMKDHQWRLTRPSMIVAAIDHISVDSAELRSGANARLFVHAVMPQHGEMSGSVHADAFPLGDVGQLFPISIPVSGAAALAISLAGTRDAPRMSFEMQAVDATLGETRVEGLHVSGTYDDRLLDAKAEYRRKNAVVLHGDAKLPLDLALRPVPKRLIDKPLSGGIFADSSDLSVLESFTSAIRKATGRLDATLLLSGSWDEPRLNGSFHVRNGGLDLPKMGLRYDNIRSYVRFMGDSIQVDTMLVSDIDHNATARLYGFVSLVNFHDPRVELTLSAPTPFHVIANKDIADLTLQTFADQGLRLRGRKSNSTLAGGAEVNGEIYVPDTYSKNIIALDASDYNTGMDTAAFGSRQIAPSMFASFIDNMTVENLSVRAGDALWLQSAEARIQLAGDLSLRVVASNRPSDRARGLKVPALTGTLTATKGTYRFDLGVVQRTFAVDGGTVRFFGDPDNNAALDIKATYTVRQFDQRDARQDVRIQATVGGTLWAPRVTLSSPDSIRISTDDLYAYLLTGGPSFEIGGRTSDYSSLLRRSLITTAGAVVGSKLGNILGLDEVDLSTAGLDSYSGRFGGAANVLRGTRLGAGKQLSDKLFMRLDAGLCQFGQLFDNTSSFDVAGFANTLGVKFDYRLTNVLTTSVGLEPPTTALLCAQGGISARGFVPTPRQIGLDIIRLWRF